MPHHLLTGAVYPEKLTRELGMTDHERDKLKVGVNLSMYEGDHWLSGAGYIGAPPDPEDRNAPKLWGRLRRSFASYNAVKEVTDRLAGCIFGQIPDYGLTVRRMRKQIPKKVSDPAFIAPVDNPTAPAPLIDDPEGATEPEALTPDEQARILEAVAALEVFYSSRKTLRFLKRLFRRRLLQGRAYLRLTIPPKFRDTGGRVPPARDLNEAVQRIFFTEPTIDDAVHLTDEESRDELSITRYKRGKVEVFELCFNDDAGRSYIATVEREMSAPAPDFPVRGVAGLLPASPLAVQILAEEDGRLLSNIPDEQISDPLELNGRLTVFEMAGDPLITEQIRSQNFSLNLNLTMSNHVTVESGFRELATTNVELETEFVPDPTAPGGRREVPKRLKRGAGAHLNFVGVTLEDAQGNETLAPTSVQAFDPVSIDNFDKGQTMFRRNILAEAHQLWALITGDAAPSGESRIQAMADFVILALDYQDECEDAGTWLTETVLNMAAVLMGKPGRFADLRANFKTRLYLGKLTAEEKQLLMTEVDKRLRSRESYQIIAGDITDPAEENARIEREHETSVEGQRARINLEADKRALGLTDAGGGSGNGNGGGGA
jgi:hypothetical protein